MLRRIRGLALIVSFGVVWLALNVSAVQAASPGSAPAASATTLPATHVSITSAVLNGLIETRGQATQWEFQYGARTDHDHSTPVMQIPAGHGTVHVSARIMGLRARTTYRFRVLAISGIGSNYVEIYYAADRTFTTKSWQGKLQLVGRRLHVSRQAIGVPLKCSSKRTCAGRVSIGTRAQGGGAMVCATKSIRIGADTTRTVGARFSQACLARLTKASNHRLKGTLSSATTTGQRGQNTPVELILG